MSACPRPHGRGKSGQDRRTIAVEHRRHTGAGTRALRGMTSVAVFARTRMRPRLFRIQLEGAVPEFELVGFEQFIGETEPHDPTSSSMKFSSGEGAAGTDFEPLVSP